MVMKNLTVASTVLLIGLTSSTIVKSTEDAVKPVHNNALKETIIESCIDYQSGKLDNPLNACKLYIDGFIDATLLTSTAVVASKQQIEKRQKSDFFRRAYETRLMQPLRYSYEEKGYEFCLPKNANRLMITSRVAKNMVIEELNEKPLKKVLFETLTRKFPCSAEAHS